MALKFYPINLLIIGLILDFRLLFEPLFGIPVPLAISPVLAIVFLGLAQNSWPVVAAAVIMALGHIPESIQNLYSVK